MLDCLFVALNSFFIICLVFVDICQVVKSVAVSGIDFNSLFVPLLCLIKFILPLINDSGIVIGTMVFRICLYSLFIVLNSKLIFSHIIVCYSSWVIKLVNILLQLVTYFICLHVTFYWIFVSLFIVVSKTLIVIEVVIVYLVLLHFNLNSVIIKL